MARAMLPWEQRALGFDPLAGLALESDADLPLIQQNLARRTPLR